MIKKIYITVWIIAQMLLLFIPMIIGVVMTPYEISYDKGYVETVNPRVLDGGSGDFNIEGAVEDWKDAEGTFYDKEWKLQHQELYYIYNITTGLVIGLAFQILNMLWWLTYEGNKYDWK